MLPIASFDNKDPAKTKNDVVFSTLSRKHLLNRLIVIDETTAFPGKKRLHLFIIIIIIIVSLSLLY
jgi:hypothetical protein